MLYIHNALRSFITPQMATVLDRMNEMEISIKMIAVMRRAMEASPGGTGMRLSEVRDEAESSAVLGMCEMWNTLPCTLSYHLVTSLWDDWYCNPEEDT